VQPRTEEWIKKSWKAGKWSSNSVINSDGEIVDARLKQGLRPTPLTRDLTWGVPVLIEKEEDEVLKGKVMCKFVPCLSKLTKADENARCVGG
jgi:methionyl-tRNA synthetase